MKTNRPSHTPFEYEHEHEIGHWDSDPDFPVEDWRAEVANNDTRLGYAEWRQHQRTSPVLPEWVQALVDKHRAGFIVMGKLTMGSVGESTIWGCDDCCCWFVVSDDEFLDRYSLVNEDGWCQGQSCDCHALPRVKPTDQHSTTIERNVP